MIVYMIVKHNEIFIQWYIYDIRHNYSLTFCQLEAMAYLELGELAIFTYCDSCGYPLVNVYITMENHHAING